jgi:hypothetical protein
MLQLHLWHEGCFLEAAIFVVCASAQARALLLAAEQLQLLLQLLVGLEGSASYHS